MSKLFHIQYTELAKAGYTVESYHDKDSQRDEFETLRFDTFTKEIAKRWVLEVCFSYKAHKPKQFELFEAGTSLVIEGTTFEVKCNTLQELTEFETAIKKALKVEGQE